MFERVLGFFIVVMYLFDTVFASSEQHNKGKDNFYLKKKIANNDRGVRMEQFAVPS